MTKKKQRRVHPAVRAERHVHSALIGLATWWEKQQIPVSAADLAAHFGKGEDWTLRCLIAAERTGHCLRDADGLWHMTADGWDRVGGCKLE